MAELCIILSLTNENALFLALFCRHGKFLRLSSARL